MSTTIQSSTGGAVVQTSVRLPLPLRENLRIEAKRLGRSLNTHIVMCLGERKAAAGDDLGGQAPAAGSQTAAL